MPQLRPKSPQSTRQSTGVAPSIPTANRNSAAPLFSNRKSQIANRKSAFTLVEVLIAVAIALLLIVGISQIFAIAQRTTSMGTELLGATAKDRSFQNTLNRDFRSILPMSDTPGFVLASYAIGAFRNKADSDSAPDPTNPLNFGPNFTNPNAPYAQAFSTNFRVHRLDRMGLFARDYYRRQTADSPNVSSSTTSTEGFVWYGHLALPNNPAIATWDPANPGAATSPGAWFNPGTPAVSPAPLNDNNQFASSFVLGRQVMLLVPAPSPAGTAPRETGYMLNPAGGPPFPLLLDPSNGRAPVKSPTETSGSTAPLFASRYDVCYTTISDWSAIISNPLNFPPASPWWQQLSGLQITGGSTTGDIFIDQRYFANPYPTKPDPSKGPLPAGWNSAAAAQTAPMFVRGCSQFIVEFAGDFTTQDPITGVVNATKADQPDGQLDFIVDPVSGQHRTRWYGFPRDTGSTTGATPSGVIIPDGTLNAFDVLPVGLFTGVARGFERQIPNVTLNTTTWAMTPASNGLPMHSQAYVCAWGPDGSNVSKPTMIRITIAVDDVNGRLNNEQTYEYVFNLP